MNRNIDSIPSELQTQFLDQLLGENPVDFLAGDEAGAIAEDAEVTIDPRAALANDPMLDLRDSPIIEDRFQALLKEHFLAKAEQNLPVFPWEDTGVQEYPDGVSESVEATNPWLAQVQNLRASVPNDVFAQLLGECQTLAQETAEVWGQMVKAAESLFPGEFRTLNDYTVTLKPALVTRSQSTAIQEALDAVDYEGDVQEQQRMTVALVMAHDLLRQLELPFSQQQLIIDRQWLTREGLLEIRAEWRPQADAMVVAIEMPCGGRADLMGEQTSTQASCDQGDSLDLLLPILPGDSTYTLSVRLATDVNPPPLTFTLRTPKQ